MVIRKPKSPRRWQTLSKTVTTETTLQNLQRVSNEFNLFPHHKPHAIKITIHILINSYSSLCFLHIDCSHTLHVNFLPFQHFLLHHFIHFHVLLNWNPSYSLSPFHHSITIIIISLYRYLCVVLCFLSNHHHHSARVVHDTSFVSLFYL